MIAKIINFFSVRFLETVDFQKIIMFSGAMKDGRHAFLILAHEQHSFSQP